MKHINMRIFLLLLISNFAYSQSVLDTLNIIDKHGTASGNYCSRLDILDIYGGLRGKPGFDSTKILDKWGTYGSINCAPALSGVWEMEKNNVETVGTHLSHNPNAYSAPLTSFASNNVTGYVDGSIGGTGTWVIQGGTQTIGGVSYPGGGLIISTGYNTIYGMTMVQTGANFQLGETVNSTTGNVYSMTVQTGASLNVYGANTTWNARISESLSNSGTINWKGSNECGKGMMQVNGWTANNGTINIDGAIFRTSQYGISGTGTINVADGGTLANAGQPVAGTQTVNLNGCGWCDLTGEKIGALSLSGYNVTYAATTNIQSPSCIYSAPGDLINFTGLLTGSEPLTIGAAGSAARAGAINFKNQANTYSGVMTVDASTLYGQGSANSLQFATINLINTSVLDVQGGQNIKSLTGDAGSKVQMSAYSTLTLKNNGETTFPGTVVATSAPPASLVLNGGATNVLTLTNPSVGNAVYVADGGSKIVLQGGTISGGFGSENGKLQATNGGIISAGATTTATTSIVQLDATSFLEVRAVGSSASKITTQVFRAPSNFKVNLPDAMAAGTYTILDGIYADGSNGFGKIPTLGINNTGKTPTFSWTGGGGAPGKLIMTLA